LVFPLPLFSFFSRPEETNLILIPSWGGPLGEYLFSDTSGGLRPGWNDGREAFDYLLSFFPFTEIGAFIPSPTQKYLLWAVRDRF